MQKGDAVARFTSSNPKIVTVNVTLRSGVKGTCTVKVQKNKVITKSIKIGTKKLTLRRGAKAAIPITLNPLTSTDKIKVTSSNKKVATVTNKGVVTAKKKGTAKIPSRVERKRLFVK